MPRIFKYGDIPNIGFTPDKELNILIYRSPFYLIIYRSHTLQKLVLFLAHPVHNRKYLCKFWFRSYRVYKISVAIAGWRWPLNHWPSQYYQCHVDLLLINCDQCHTSLHLGDIKVKNRINRCTQASRLLNASSIYVGGECIKIKLGVVSPVSYHKTFWRNKGNNLQFSNRNISPMAEI